MFHISAQVVANPVDKATLWARCCILVAATLLTSCGGGGTSTLTPATGVGGESAFVSPIAGAVNIDIAGGGGFGIYDKVRYPNHQRPVDAADPLGRANHWGIDLEVGSGTTVVSSCAGTVIRATGVEDLHPQLGGLVVVRCADIPGRGFIYTMYAHLSRVSVSPSASVSQGQEIAKSGSTGNVTGAHLHFAFIESPTEIQFSTSGPTTGVNPKEPEWKDPARFVSNWSAYIGPGFQSAVQAPDLPPVVELATAPTTQLMINDRFRLDVLVSDKGNNLSSLEVKWDKDGNRFANLSIAGSGVTEPISFSTSYDKYGIYDWLVRSTDVNGNQDTIRGQVEVSCSSNSGVQPTFEWFGRIPASIDAGSNFSAELAIRHQSGIGKIRFEYGDTRYPYIDEDGGNGTVIGLNLVQTYATPGTYTWRLIAWSKQCDKRIETGTIVVR